MESPEEIKAVKVNLSIDFKGGKKELSDTMPDIENHKDYYDQYFGIWKVMFDKVIELKAKTVLEFGTREGYSTRLFSKVLKTTEGHITSIDINPPKTPFEEDNITAITMPVEDFEGFPCDILYIDDWHNAWHLYYELNRFAKFARVIMIHDVCLDDLLLQAVTEWCKRNMMVYSVYPLNGCGLAVIEVEKSGLFYANEYKTTSEQGGAK